MSTAPDPNRCPYCETVGELREIAKRLTWQPCTMGLDEHGVPAPIDYERFDTADTTTDETYECGSCCAEWPSLYALGSDQRAFHEIEQERDHYGRRSERLRALADAPVSHRACLDSVNGLERIAEADGAAEGLALALHILRGQHNPPDRFYWLKQHRAKLRLEELRAELRAERISYGELAELQSLAPFIDPGDFELREAAGIPEHDESA